MQIVVSIADNLHEMPNPAVFPGKIRKKYLKMLSAEIFIQRVKH